MFHRRDFLKKLGLAATVSSMGSIGIDTLEGLGPDSWKGLKKKYLRGENEPINFNTGSAGIMPLPIINDYKKNLLAVHSGAPYDIAARYNPRVKASLSRLSALLQASQGELALMPNTTTALNAVLYGIPWKSGDEIIHSNVDYPLVQNTMRLLEHKYGVVTKKVELALQQYDPQEMLSKYQKAYTPQTRLTLLTHMTHKEGRIMPVRLLAAQAKEHGAQVLLDGAHTAGQFRFSLEELGCDYYATSLHKWMSAPLGTGLLFVKKDRLKELSPPISYNADMHEQMSMFTVHGTSAFQNAMTLEAVLDYQDEIGLDAKALRLRAMADYLRAGLAEIDRVEIITPEEASCAICSFAIKGNTRMAVIKRFEQEHNIHIKYTSYPKLKGFFRASLNLNLDESDIDLLLAGVRCFAQEK